MPNNATLQCYIHHLLLFSTLQSALLKGTLPTFSLLSVLPLTEMFTLFLLQKNSFFLFCVWKTISLPLRVEKAKLSQMLLHPEECRSQHKMLGYSGMEGNRFSTYMLDSILAIDCPVWKTFSFCSSLYKQ